MTTPARVQRWDADNVERTNARKVAYKRRQRTRKEAVAQAAQKKETTDR